MTKKTWLITGATSPIAQAFAHIAAQSGCNLILLGRNPEELTLISNDLRIRYPIQCVFFVVDFTEDIAPALEKIQQNNDELAIFLAHSHIVDNPELVPSTIATLIQTNITSIAQLIQTYFAKPQEKHELIFLSSVAASRGRAKNSLYGASKRAIEVYLEGIQQQANPNQHITIARLGYIDTTQTYGLPGIFYASPPKNCAKACWRACEQQKRHIFHPFFWQLIMGIIQRLPFVIYKRLQV